MISARENTRRLFDDDRPALGIGVVRCVRERPGAGTAEVAAAVADDWQARGVGTLLLSHLKSWARTKRIAYFKAQMFADNRAAEALMRKLGPIVQRQVLSRGVIELTADITED